MTTQQPSTPAAGAGSPFPIDPWVREILRCPVSGATLVDDARRL